MLAMAPRPYDTQTFFPRSLCAPSIALSMACASRSLRQLGAAAAPGAPHILIAAGAWQVRGSLSSPSTTPSCASHWLIILVTVALVFPSVIVPPVSSLPCHVLQVPAPDVLEWLVCGAPMRKPSKSSPYCVASTRPWRPPVEQPS